MIRFAHHPAFRACAILWMAGYLLLATSIDRLHNHGSVGCEHCPDTPAVAAVEVSPAGDTLHAACPVLILTLSHAPGLSPDPAVAMADAGTIQSPRPARLTPLALTPPTSRGPPALRSFA